MLGAAPAFADNIDDAAKKLSDASYPFLKEIDWTADYAKNIPGADPLQMAKAISKTIDMGAAMGPICFEGGRPGSLQGDWQHRCQRPDLQS